MTQQKIMFWSFFKGGYISHLEKISNSIREPEEEEPLVWEYLWNDPLSKTTLLPPETKIDSSGFVPNFRRGTGHLLTEKALTDFLTRNGLSHVIRAHEVKEVGFHVQHQRRFDSILFRFIFGLFFGPFSVQFPLF